MRRAEQGLLKTPFFEDEGQLLLEDDGIAFEADGGDSRRRLLALQVRR